jgi:hypothetical protein
MKVVLWLSVGTLPTLHRLIGQSAQQSAGFTSSTMHLESRQLYSAMTAHEAQLYRSGDYILTYDTKKMQFNRVNQPQVF